MTFQLILQFLGNYFKSNHIRSFIKINKYDAVSARLKGGLAAFANTESPNEFYKYNLAI